MPPCSKILPDVELSALPDDAPLSDQQLGTPTKIDKGKAIQEQLSPGTPIEQISHRISPSSGPWSKVFLEKVEELKHAEVLEDPNKRRSKRMQNNKKGFKDPQCSTKKCLGCTVVPPNLSPSVIRNLGASFCKVDEKVLTVQALQKKKKPPVPTPGGKKAPEKKNNSDDTNDEATKKDPQEIKKVKAAAAHLLAVFCFLRHFCFWSVIILRCWSHI